MRIIAVFEKGARLRHIGHLDIIRAMQRTLRRSGLPVRYSNGFNPHILVNFASPLSVGFVGENEIMDVMLSSDVDCGEFFTKMNAALPESLKLKSAKVIQENAPSLMSLVCAASYRIEITDIDTRDILSSSYEKFISQPQITAEKKSKSGMKEVDIKPWIFSLTSSECGFEAVLSLTEKETCRPALMIDAMCKFAGCSIPRMNVTRENILGKDASGNLICLQDCL